MELIHRNVLQVVERDVEGRPEVCKMHDLLRELSLSKLETEKFCAIANCDGREANENEREARRLSIQFIGRSSESLLQSRKGMSQLRSLFVFAKGNISPTLETLPHGLRSLRLLDLEDVPIENLPDELVDLFNLRYLNLRGTRVKKLPESIGRLRNVETLDISESQIKELPGGVTKLKKLRHLIMYRFSNYEEGFEFKYVYGTPAPSDICKLKNLQVLTYVEAKEDLMKRVRNMTQLKNIGFTNVKEADEEDLCIAMQNMSLLHHLMVMVTNEDEYLRMDALSSAPPCLKRLILAGKLEKVPRWFHSLQSLTQLFLYWSRLAEDDEDWLPYIQALPNLGKLILHNACEGRRLCFFTTGFHKLRELSLRNFPLLEEIIIESGVMPGLQLFYIGSCMQLKMLPDGIRYLRKLEELDLRFVSNELVESINGEAGRDNPTIRHIPRVKCWG